MRSDFGMQKFIETDTYITIGGDFAKVFDQEDYMIMINALDEASVVLRAHLILEEFLNIWASRLTKTDDLFAGLFVSYKTKLFICRNLGLPAQYFEIIDKFNEFRNRYSHRRKFSIEANALNSVCEKIDALPSTPEMFTCKNFELFIEGTDNTGMRRKLSYTWETADVKKRITVTVIVFVLKLVKWMQSEFSARGIQYDLIVWPVAHTDLEKPAHN